MTDAQLILIWIAGIYFGVWTITSFVVMALDKRRANLNKRRIKESALIWLIGLGGVLGIIFGGQLFRHKTQKISFHLKGIFFGGGLLVINLAIWYLIWYWLS